MRAPRPQLWYRKAERDLAMARRMLEAGFCEDVAFHSQQAAEKHLKGLFIERHRMWKRGHKCAEFLAALAQLGDTPPPGLVLAAEGLDKHYLGSRYPDVPDDRGSGAADDWWSEATPVEETRYTVEVAKVALATAEAIIRFATERAAEGPDKAREAPAEYAGAGKADSGYGPGVEPRVIDGFARALAARLPVKALVVFGSRVRGEHSEASDYDFALISDGFAGLSQGERYSLPQGAWRAVDADLDADIFCLTPGELAELPGPLVWDALREGIVVVDDGVWAEATTAFRYLLEAGTLVPIKGGWFFGSAGSEPPGE